MKPNRKMCIISEGLTIAPHTLAVEDWLRGLENAMRDISEMELMLKGYGITTAQLLYHMPDHPHLLQTFVWQDYDIAPKFPVLVRFIEFWQATLDGPLHSITYTHQKLIAPNEWRKVDGEFVLH